VTSDDSERRRNVRRTTIIFVAVAVAFYVGFILMGIARS